jgi:hypothetical protein
MDIRPRLHASRRAAGALSVAIALLCFSATPPPLPGQLSQGSIHVLLVDAETGDPVPGATVRAAGAFRPVDSDPEGRVRLDEVPPGPTTIVVTRIGYAEVRQVVRVVAGTTTEVTIALVPRPVAVAPVAVEAPRRPSRMDDFNRRRQGSVGHFFTFEDIERARPAVTSDLLRRVAGLRVHCTMGPCTVRSARASTPRCPMQVFVDGVAAYQMSPDEIPAADLEGMEIYRGASEIPPEFNRGTAMCGVIVIWTADPQRRRGG